MLIVLTVFTTPNMLKAGNGKILLFIVLVNMVMISKVIHMVLFMVIYHQELKLKMMERNGPLILRNIKQHLIGSVLVYNQQKIGLIQQLEKIIIGMLNLLWLVQIVQIMQI